MRLSLNYISIVLILRLRPCRRPHSFNLRFWWTLFWWLGCPKWTVSPTFEGTFTIIRDGYEKSTISVEPGNEKLYKLADLTQKRKLVPTFSAPPPLRPSFSMPEVKTPTFKETKKSTEPRPETETKNHIKKWKRKRCKKSWRQWGKILLGSWFNSFNKWWTKSFSRRCFG